jgi:hypothetical protein
MNHHQSVSIIAIHYHYQPPPPVMTLHDQFYLDDRYHLLKVLFSAFHVSLLDCTCEKSDTKKWYAKATPRLVTQLLVV